MSIETDLPLVRGEEYEILDTSGVWWMAKNAAGEIGLIPYNYVEPIDRQQAQPPTTRPKSLTSTDNATLNCCCPAAENCSANNPPLPIDLAQLAQLGLPWTGCGIDRVSGNGKRQSPVNANNEYASSTSTLYNSSGTSDEEKPSLKSSKVDSVIVGPGCDWWHPHLNRETAEGILRTVGKEGAFLVRLSTTEVDCYTLSLLNKR